MHLRNEELTPRWFLIPVAVSPAWEPGADTIDSVRAFALDGTGRVVLARLHGQREWHALRLPGAGEVHVRGLAVLAFDDGGPFAIEVLATPALALDGRPLEE